MKDKKNRKRKFKKSVNEDDEPDEKVAKLISADELREQLKGPTPIKALKEYMQSDNKIERISEYIAAGGSVSELLVVLNNFDLRKNVTPAIPVFQALKLFIVKFLSDAPASRKKLVEECRQLLSIHLNLLFSMLSGTRTPKERKTSLELLTVLASCHESVAWEIISKFNLPPHDIQALAAKKRHNDTSSVRDSLIPFLVSFLVDQPSNIVVKFLQTRGLLTSIFPGLINDQFKLILVVIETFKTKIVENRDISKSLKLNIFNTTSMCHLLSAYNWDPTFGATELGRVNEEDKATVRIRLHKLMLLLLSEKQGIVFSDLSIGTSGKCMNELIVNMIKQAGTPWRDGMIEEVYIKMMHSAPDIIKPFFNHIEQYFKSSTGERYCSIINFISSLLDTVDIDVNSCNENTRHRVLTQIYMPEFILSTVKEKLKNGTTEEKLCASRCLSVCLKQVRARDPSAGNVAKHAMFILTNVAELIMQNLEYWTTESFDIDGIDYSLDCVLDAYVVCPQLLDSIRFRVCTKEAIAVCIEAIKDAVTMTAESDEKTNICGLKAVELMDIIWPLEHTCSEYAFWMEDLCFFIINNSNALRISLSIFERTLVETSYFTGSYEVNLWLHALSTQFGSSVGCLVLETIHYSQKNLKKLYQQLTAAQTDDVETESSMQAMDLESYLQAALITHKDNAPVNVNLLFTPSVLLLSLIAVVGDSDKYEDCEAFIQDLLMNACHTCSSPTVLFNLLNKYPSNSLLSPVLSYVKSWLAKKPTPPSCMSSTFKNQYNYFFSSDDNAVDLEQVTRLTTVLLASQGLFYFKCGALTAKKLSPVISRIIKKYPDLSPLILSHPCLLQTFSPLSSPEGTLISNHIILALCDGGHAHLPLGPFSQKLAFLIRCAVLKKSSLKEAKDVFKILNIFGLPNSELMYIVDNCIPIPKKCLKGVVAWFEIVAYALKQLAHSEVDVPQSDFVALLKQYVDYMSSDTDENISSSIGLFLSLKYVCQRWDSDQLSILTDILTKMCCLDFVWHPLLAIEVFRAVGAINMDIVDLERAMVLLSCSDAFTSVTPIIDMLTVKYKPVFKEILSAPYPDWIDCFCDILEHPAVTGRHLTQFYSYLEKKMKHIKLCKTNLYLISSACIKTNNNDLLLTIVQKYLENPTTVDEVIMLKLLARSLEQIFTFGKHNLDSSSFQTCIMIGMKESDILDSLTIGVDLKKTDMEASRVFELVTNHSLFLESLIDNKYQSRRSLVSLLLACIKEDPSVMKSSHLPVYLSAYNATLSVEDHVLFRIFQEYEKHGISYTEWKPIVWGPLAVQKYSVREVKKRVDVTLSPTIDLLDSAMVNKTITFFPIERLVESVKDNFERRNEIYDPAFILSVLSQSVGPGSDVPPRKVVRSGALGLAIASLNSNCVTIRGIGYHILHSFYQSLAERKFDEVFINFIDTLRETVSDQHIPRINGVLSVFLARASLIMTEPPHPLYPPINNFLIAVDVFRTDSVPAFMDLFFCMTPNRSQAVQFILEVIRDGLRNPLDLPVLLHSNTLKIILTYYDSPLSTSVTKGLVEEIIAALFKKVDYRQNLLTKAYSIIPWLAFNNKLSLASENIRNFKKFYNI